MKELTVILRSGEAFTLPVTDAAVEHWPITGGVKQVTYDSAGTELLHLNHDQVDAVLLETLT